MRLLQLPRIPKWALGQIQARSSGMRWHWPIPPCQRVRGSRPTVALFVVPISAFVANKFILTCFSMAPRRKTTDKISKRLFIDFVGHILTLEPRCDHRCSRREVFLALAYLNCLGSFIFCSKPPRDSIFRFLFFFFFFFLVFRRIFVPVPPPSQKPCMHFMVCVLLRIFNVHEPWNIEIYIYDS